MTIGNKLSVVKSVMSKHPMLAKVTEWQRYLQNEWLCDVNDWEVSEMFNFTLPPIRDNLEPSEKLITNALKTFITN